MEKVMRNGLVAVLYSPGYGAGWGSWSSNKDIIFDSRIVEKVEQDKQSEITESFMESIGYYVYCGGAKDLEIEWIPIGSQFEIEEYDGDESIHIIGDRQYFIA